MIKMTPMLQVDDVEASSRWYQALLELRSGHGGPDYEMLFVGEPHASAMVLQLHRWDAHEHGHLGKPDIPRGNGISLWMMVADRSALDAAWSRVAQLQVTRLEAPHWNTLARHHEFAVQDPDGYVIVLCTPYSAAS